MLRLFKLAGLCLSVPFFSFVYFMIFGPVLAVAFASTAGLAALATVIGLERLGYSKGDARKQRVIEFFAVFLMLGALLEPSDPCADRGGVWNWYAVECRGD